MTISIAFRSIYVSGTNGERCSLNALDDDEYSHIHGELRIEVAGRRLPHMGFFGPEDVCFNIWTRELTAAVKVLRPEDPSTYTFDEGEQGQPAFQFRREEQVIFVSIVDSVIGDGIADETWQRVPCTLRDFEFAVSTFLVNLRGSIENGDPNEAAQNWLVKNNAAM